MHLWLPRLPTDRLASGCVPPEAPRATVDTVRGARVLAAVDEAASGRGLAPGLTLAEARALVPGLRVDAADPDGDAAALRALARAANRYTPLVGLAPPDGITLDITGCAHLFGGEAAMLDDALARLARWRWSAVRGAVAENPAIAWGVARHGPGGVVPAGHGPAVVDPLPVEALQLPAESVSVLARLGIRTVRQLLMQPRAPLVQRFGPLLARRIDAMAGRDGEPITPLAPVAPYTAERRFAEPLMQMEAVGACLASLAARLCDSLHPHGEGARRLTVRLFHADGTVREATVLASEPLADPARMTRLLAARLERLSERMETDSGIDLIRLHGEETAPLVTLQGEFDGSDAATADLAALVDTLGERLGAGAVQRAVPADTHQPARAEQRLRARDALRPVPWPALAPHEAAAPPDRPLRLLSPPEPVETLASVPDGPPVRFVWRRVFHTVAVAEGPERIAADWWDTPDALTCDYFRVEDTAGRRFWMFRRGLYGRETSAPRWFMHGLFA